MNFRLPVILGLALLLADAPLTAQDEAAFVKGLDVVRKTMNRGKWDRALQQIQQILAKHENQLYVRIRRPEVEELAKQCAFRQAHAPVEIDDLISGKLLSFNAKTGDIAIEYTMKTLDDFHDPAEEQRQKKKREEAERRKQAEERRKRAKERGEFGGFIDVPLVSKFDFLKKGTEHWPTPIWHPLRFQGPYEIEVIGSHFKTETHSRYEYPGVVVMVCVEGKDFHAVRVGYDSILAHIDHYPDAAKRRRSRRPEDSAQAPFSAGAPFRVVVRVSEKSIGTYSLPYGKNKRTRKNWHKRVEPYLSRKSKQKREVFGSFGIQAEGYDRLIVRGVAGQGWIQGLQDARFQSRWATFSKEFDPGKILPKWFLEPLPVLSGAKFEHEELWPEEFEFEVFEVLRRVFKSLGNKQPRTALRTVEAHTDEIPAATTEYLRAMCHRADGQVEKALKNCDKLVVIAPTFLRGKELRAALLLELNRPGDALVQFDRAITEHPKVMHLHLDAMILLMRTGRQVDASKRMRAFLTKFGATREILQLQRMLSMIERGPSWPRVHEYRSKNYIVRSDIDKQTCREASRVLEEAFILFKNRIGWVKRKPGESRFRVYLFRGQSGYQNYAGQILGDRSPHTAGLYSPSLKQLLIWNLPKRQEMLRTVRHEGFHQYLHSLVGADIPSWLNEGLAEYYENAERQRNRLQGGQARPDHAKTLRDFWNGRNQLSLARFLHLSPRAFYSRPSVHYAQAWQLVHFLQHGPREYRPLFKKLLKELKSGAGTNAALTNTFGSVDLTAMSNALKGYVAPK